MKRKINLFTSFYEDSNPSRANELKECLIKNSIDKNIDRVILMNHPRPTYMDFFVMTQDFPDDINIIANSDIYFDDSLCILKSMAEDQQVFEKIITKSDISDICLALTRWDVMIDNIPSRFIDRGSQDAWIFFGAVKNMDKMDASYSLGTPGCDNRIAREIFDAGYQVYNPSETIRILHLHNTGIRNYKIKDTVFGNHMLIDATNIYNMEKETSHYFKLLEKSEINGYEPEPIEEPIPKVILNPLKQSPAFSNPLKRNKSIQAKDAIRIQHIALSTGDNALTRALRGIGTYDEIDWGSLLRTYGKEKMNEIILERVNNFNPHIVFMQLQTDDVFFPETAMKISEKAFFIHWGGDKRDPIPDYFTSIAPFVSITCCTCEDDINTLRRMGHKAEFLQIGFDHGIYRPGLPAIDGVAPLLFMANNYGSQFPLSDERASMVNFMRSEFGESFKVIGNGWPFERLTLMGNQNMEARYYNSCKIAINFNHFNSLRYTSDRLFRILGSGAFCLSHHYKGIEQDFQIGVHLDTFRNMHELAEKCRDYTFNDATRSRIAMKGREYVHSRFTFDHMAQNILNIYNKYKKNESTELHTASLR